MHSKKTANSEQKIRTRTPVAIFRLLRPRQWAKIVFVFAPLFFAHRFIYAEAWEKTILAALAFLSASCAVYVFNDIRDIAEDRLHPVKRNRPLAQGSVSVAAAFWLLAGMALAAWGLSVRLPAACQETLALYAALNMLYTFRLKHIALIDVFCIASFYVLRVLMGCYALEVSVSPWIILSTFLLALFLGFGKRRHEMGFEHYAQAKRNLRHYTQPLLDKLVTITGGAALLTYAIYSAEIAGQTGRVEMAYTTGFVAFGLFRYLQSIDVYGQGGEPETAILGDALQLLNLAAWFCTTMWVMFGQGIFASGH